MKIESGPTQIRFLEMTYTRLDAARDVDWKLRYSPGISKDTIFLAASIVSAYISIIEQTQRDRNLICQTIKNFDIASRSKQNG
jgi:hypothetical protein